MGVSAITLMVLLSTAPTQQGVVESAGNRVTVRAVNTPLRDLVREIATRTGIRVSGADELKGAESIDIRDGYLEEVLKALLARVNYVVTREQGTLHLHIHSMIPDPSGPAPVARDSSRVASVVRGPSGVAGPITIAGLTDVTPDNPPALAHVEARTRPADVDDRRKVAAQREEREEIANLERATQSTDEDATLEISAGLTSQHVNVRIRALHLLAARGGDPDAVAEIASAFSDEDSAVMLTASSLLASIPGKDAQDAIESLLEPDAAPELHYAALRSLALRGDPSSITAVRRAAEQGPAEVRGYAEQLLAALEQRAKKP
jgi:hypothetical protein